MSIGFGALNAGLHKHCVFNVDGANPRSNKGEPTTNLANTSGEAIDWDVTNLNATVSRTTINASNYHYQLVCTYNTGNYFRMRFNANNLINGETYTVSYKYKITSGGGQFRANDWNDQSITRNTTYVGDGWYYETATGSRSEYNSTYRFLDFYISNNMTVEIKEVQLEQRSTSTPFTAYQRNKWYDVSGNGYDVTLYNNPTSGDSNGTFQFRSRNDSDMSYGAATFNEGVLKQGNEAGAWAIETLYKYVSAAPRSECVVAGRSGCHGGIYMYADGWLKHAIKTDSCWNGALNENIVQQSVGEWYHTIQSYEHGVQRSYLNGELVDTATLDINTRNMNAYNDTFRIGGIKSGTTYYATNTDIAFIRCYNTHINEIEALKLYHSAKGRMK